VPQHHVTRPRGADVTPRSVLVAGRFGRLFRNLPAFEPDDEPLRALAERMREPETQPAPQNQWQPSRDEEVDSDIPAGYTYLGQFVDHDITFDPVSSLQRQNDPEGLHDFRTPRFDLDSLYGDGPNNDPYMYDSDIDDGRTTLLVGKNENNEPDLPRNVLPPSPSSDPRGRALIGDPRNDENIIVGQLHLLFLRFHNKVVERVREEQPNLERDALFEEAQRVARWHYQWVVVHDFLGRVAGSDVVEDVLRPRTYRVSGGEASVRRVSLQFYGWQHSPFMPVEFSVAAYRFGHSMIRPTYKINDTVPELPIFADHPSPGPLEAFHGFRPLPKDWTIDWQFFFETGDGSRLQMARRLDAKLAGPTFRLPGLDPAELAFRNLLRAKRLGLPSGQRVSRAMGIEPLSDEELGILDISQVFAGNAPLWFYLLREADLRGAGRLGPVGGRIVTEVLLGLLKGDPFSYVNVEPNWTPTLGDGDFTMPDLIRFVQQ
jgi:hypothetical protein